MRARAKGRRRPAGEREQGCGRGVRVVRDGVSECLDPKKYFWQCRASNPHAVLCLLLRRFIPTILPPPAPQPFRVCAGLFLQGFKPKARLKMQYNVKNCKFLRPDESVITGSKVLFTAMLQKCLDKNVVPICRLVARYNSAPTFVALLPQQEEAATADAPDGQAGGFQVITLPFADDMRKLPYEKKPALDAETAEAHRKAAGEVVSKLQSATYVPGKYENVALSKFHKYIEAIVFDRDDVEAIDTMKPDLEAMAATVGDEVAKFTALVYPADYTGAPPKKRKAGGAAGGAAKKPKKEPVDMGSLDFKQMATDGTLKKQTVKVLKQFLVSVGRAGTGKKADLLEAIQEHFGL